MRISAMKISLGTGTTGIIASRCYNEDCTRVAPRLESPCWKIHQGQTDHNESGSCTFNGQPSLDLW
eukprot:scaffold9290_cov95-Skeletonema_marinoi.AAC.1